MMWWLLACAPAPDPEALLRAGDPRAAAAAATEMGTPSFDPEHPLVPVIMRRVGAEAHLTMGFVSEAVAAARLLDARPKLGRRAVDRPFEDMATLMAGAERVLTPPAIAAVGRSRSRGDADAYQPGASLPWEGGRMVGWARLDTAPGAATGTLVALGRTVDADPPAKLVTLGFEDDRGPLWIFVERDANLGWMAIAASDPERAAAVLVAGERARPPAPRAP